MRWPFNWLALTDEPCSAPPFKEYVSAAVIPLPDPVLPETSLRLVVADRFSCRRFAGTALTLTQLATLLMVTYGIQGRTYLGDLEMLDRPVPSGGGLYPLEIYLLVQHVENVEPGIYHYAVLNHALEQIQAVCLPKPVVSGLFMEQPYILDAAVIIILVAFVERSLWKYGDRGYRYILLEAGHVAQNVNLMSTALGLGSLNLGGFHDADLAQSLQLDLETEIPLYGVAVGVPSTGNRAELRWPSAFHL